MAIEQLLKPNINARDFQPIPEKPKGKTELMFEDLKQSRFYDRYKGIWKSENKVLSAQFFGVIVQGIFNKKKARDDYKELKHLSSKDLALKPQLLEILAEQTFDKKNAQEQYTKVKGRFNLYDSIDDPSIKDELLDESIQHEEQLLRILIESMFDTELGKKKYEANYTSKFHRKPWNPNGSFIRRTEDELLSVWIESIFDKEEARSRYEHLKSTPLYNKEKKYWESIITQDGGKVWQKPGSSEQLLGILLEHILEEKLETFTQEKPAPLPEIRIF